MSQFNAFVISDTLFSYPGLHNYFAKKMCLLVSCTNEEENYGTQSSASHDFFQKNKIKFTSPKREEHKEKKMRERKYHKLEG